MSMVLTFDIGNTNITLCGFVSDKIAFVSRISADTSVTSDEFAFRIINSLSLHGVDRNDISGVIAASVVPPFNASLKRAVRLG